MEIEEVFSSKLRVKILKLIYRLGELNVSDIARRIGINFAIANQHLNLLEQEGIVQQRVYGRIRMYRFNQASTKAKAIQDFIEAWEQANKTQTTQLKEKNL
ncbi:MAG: winged helix-turn-helix domain-containing protein [Candidatus Bathyarchaeota archaeon]|nr:winged helix-turn-helix domain-containing protein [Candidatus Bathyarchaeota archaeon]